MKIVRVIFYGRVQGVGFRAYIESIASVSGVEGWVRNRSDGTVEAVLAGDGSLIQGILTASRKGPPVSCVKKIDTTEASEKDLALRTKGETFSVLPTV